MSIEFEKHSELKPAVEQVAKATRPAHEPIRKNIVPDVEEILDHIDEKVEEVLSKYENTVIDPNKAEQLKLELHDVSHLIGSVAVTAVEDTAEVAIQVLVRGAESWINAKFAAKTINDVVNTTQDVDDGGEPKPAKMRGGKSTTGVQGSAPYSEPPEHNQE